LIWDLQQPLATDNFGTYKYKPTTTSKKLEWCDVM
jgi:hypothetical protein